MRSGLEPGDHSAQPLLESLRHIGRAPALSNRRGEPPVKLEPIATVAADLKVLIDRRQRGRVQGLIEVPGSWRVSQSQWKFRTQRSSTQRGESEILG
jgi:hypothetical protein